MAKRGRPKKTRPEVITRKSSSDMLTLFDNLGDPDRILEKLGVDADTAFLDTTTDDHLTSVMGTRQAALKGMSWNLTVGKSNERVLGACQEMLDGINMNHQGQGIPRAIDDMLQANPWGMSAMEVIWQTGETVWKPVQLKGRPFRYFTFDNANELRFLSKNNSYDGVEIPDKTVILCRHWITSNSFDNPYGDKLLSKSYWPVFFKRNGMQWYNIMLEKFGIPWVHGKVDAGVSKVDKDQFADDLANTIQDAVLVTRKNEEVELIEMATKGDAGKPFTDLFHYMDSALSKIWLGETLTTEIGDKGSYAAAKTHQGVKDERVEQDRQMVISGFKTLVNWFVELNFGENVPAPDFDLIKPLGVNVELSERDKNLQDGNPNLKLTSLYYQRHYGFEEDEIEITEGTEPPDGNFSKFAKDKRNPEQKAVDVMIEDLTPEELQKQMDGILKPVIELIKNGSDYNEVLKKLTSVYKDMDSEKLEMELLKAYNLADSFGRLSNA